MKLLRSTSTALISVLMIAGCSSTNATPDKPRAIVLLAYDSFVLSKGVLEGFTKRTGIPVKVVTQGDAGELINTAILTKASPESGVLWGVDSTFLSRGIAEEIFSPYTSKLADDLDPELRALVPKNEVTPVDRGDVCVNYDRAELARRGVEPPNTLEALTDPKYRGMLVVQSPSTSSPGLAFLLATVARFGDQKPGGWQDYWKRLKANDVKITSGWTEAYETWFSAGGGKGDRPLVVSYATSPAAAVLFGPDPTATTAPTGVIEDTCYRQVEFAGVLRGEAQDEARQLLDFLVSPAVQEDMQLNMFVLPSNTKATIDKAFTSFALFPAKAAELAPERVGANRERWIDEWTNLLT